MIGKEKFKGKRLAIDEIIKHAKALQSQGNIGIAILIMNH